MGSIITILIVAIVLSCIIFITKSSNHAYTNQLKILAQYFGLKLVSDGIQRVPFSKKPYVRGNYRNIPLMICSYTERAVGDDEMKKMLSSAIGSSIIEHIPLHDQMRVMDFGAGTGLISSQIAPLVKKIVAVDISEAMLNNLVSKPELHGKVEVVCQDLFYLLNQPTHCAKIRQFWTRTEELDCFLQEGKKNNACLLLQEISNCYKLTQKTTIGG